MVNLEDALDRLYGAPLETFTQTRNELSSALASAGDREGAAALKALKKPNLAAWAVNQLSRRYGAELERLLEATDRVRRAQRRVLSGGKPSVLREASDERAKIVVWLTRKAGELLRDGGHAAATTTLQAVTSSLNAVVGPDAAELVRRGRLTRELRPEAAVGLDHGGGLTLVSDDGEDPADEEPVDRRSARIEARAAVNEAMTRAQDARRALERAESEVADRVREADEAERSAKAAREAAEFARRAADARRAEVDDAQAALEAAKTALDELDG